MAAVGVLAAAVVVGLLQGQSNKFGGFVGDKQTDADCSIAKTQFKSRVSCDPPEKPSGWTWPESCSSEQRLSASEVCE